MSCRECEFNYLQDKTDVLERVIRLQVNVMTESNTSSGTSNAQKACVKAITEFEHRWKGLPVCPHGRPTINDVIPTGERVIEFSAGVHTLPGPINVSGGVTITGKRKPGRPPKVSADD